MSVSSAAAHNSYKKESKTEMKPIVDMSFDLAVAPSQEVIYYANDTYMSLNTISIAFPTKVENSNLIVYGHRRWQSTGYISINKFKTLKYPLIDCPRDKLLARADDVARN